MTVTDYLTEEVSTKYRHVGSLYRKTYDTYSGSEGAEEQPPKFISWTKSAPPSALANVASTSADILFGQGVVSLNHIVGTADITLLRSGSLARWHSSECFDLRNILLSNFGQAVTNLLWVNEQDIVPRRTQPAQTNSVLLSDDVLSLCSRYQVSSYLQRSLRLAQESFSDLRKISVTTESDPETDEEWVVIVAQIHGEVNSILDQYDLYTREFIKAVPWPAQEKIRLVYDLI